MSQSFDRKRYITAASDLTEAHEYVKSYLEFANSMRYMDAYGSLGIKMSARMEHALLVTGVIAYARCFVQTRGGGKTRLPGIVTRGFSRAERNVHKYVMEARHKLLAHSDSETHLIWETKLAESSEISLVRPLPIVVIEGESDSMNFREGKRRVGRQSLKTLSGFREIAKESEREGNPVSFAIHGERVFDIEQKAVEVLIGMIEKVHAEVAASLGWETKVFDVDNAWDPEEEV